MWVELHAYTLTEILVNLLTREGYQGLPHWNICHCGGMHTGEDHMQPDADFMHAPHLAHGVDGAVRVAPGLHQPQGAGTHRAARLEHAHHHLRQAVLAAPALAHGAPAHPKVRR